MDNFWRFLASMHILPSSNTTYEKQMSPDTSQNQSISGSDLSSTAGWLAICW